jgi:hypothetical protein
MAIEIIIEAVQHTPDREPVIIQYTGHGVTTGPFARTQQHHTTQTALSNRYGTPDYWSDAEVKAELLAHLEAHGLSATIVDNVDPPQPEADAPQDDARQDDNGDANG